jgi:hypothetical protein
MMVHVEYAFLAGPAVVGTLRLEDVTHDAVDLPSVLWVVHEIALSGKQLTQYVGTFPGSLNIDLPRLHNSMNKLR